MDFDSYTPRDFMTWLAEGLEHYVMSPTRPFEGFVGISIPHYEYLVPALRTFFFSLRPSTRENMKLGLAEAARELPGDHPRFLEILACYAELAAEFAATAVLDVFRCHLFAGRLSSVLSEAQLDCVTVVVHTIDTFVPSVPKAATLMEDLYDRTSIRTRLPTSFLLAMSQIHPRSWPIFFKDWALEVGPDLAAGLPSIADNLLDRIGMRSVANGLPEAYVLARSSPVTRMFVEAMVSSRNSSLVLVGYELVSRATGRDGVWYLTRRANFDEEKLCLNDQAAVDGIPVREIADSHIFAELTEFLGSLATPKLELVMRAMAA